MKFATISTSVFLASAVLLSGNAFAQSNLQMGVHLQPCTNLATKLVYNCKKKNVRYYKRVQFERLALIEETDGRDGNNSVGGRGGRGGSAGKR